MACFEAFVPNFPSCHSSARCMTCSPFSSLISRNREWDKATMLHPEYTKRCVGHRCIERCCNTKPKYSSGVTRINNAIIPEASSTIVGIPFSLVLIENGLFKSSLLFFTHPFATDSQPFLTHCSQHTGSLFSTHDRDAGIWPHPQLAW